MERAKLGVVKHYRKVYANREAEQEYRDSDLYKPDIPTPLLKHSYVSSSVATDVMVKKYADGLPLYRHEQQWKHLDVPIKRGTMANWMIKLSQRYFARFLAACKEFLKQHGRMMHGGTIVDATIIDASSFTKNTEGKRDPEMHQTRKGNQWFFGAKLHVGVDAGSGYIHTAIVTAANVADSAVAADLIREDDHVAYGDSAYCVVDQH